DRNPNVFSAVPGMVYELPNAQTPFVWTGNVTPSLLEVMRLLGATRLATEHATPAESSVPVLAWLYAIVLNSNRSDPAPVSERPPKSEPDTVGSPLSATKLFVTSKVP